MYLKKVTDIHEITADSTIILTGNNYKNEPLKIDLVKVGPDGTEIIINKKANTYFNLGMYLRGDSWVKELYILAPGKHQPIKATESNVSAVLDQLGLNTHYLGQKPIKDWDKYDQSNWRSLQRKAGRKSKKQVTAVKHKTSGCEFLEFPAYIKRDSIYGYLSLTNDGRVLFFDYDAHDNKLDFEDVTEEYIILNHE